LPAINLSGGNLVQTQTIRQHKVPSPPTQDRNLSKHRIQVVTTRRKTQGKKERELEERQRHLRAELIDLNKVQTAEYRHTYKHNLCLDMLAEGFHKSFGELFALIRQQNEERQIAGPESVLWNKVLLENEPEKLDVLKAYLTQSEAADRIENYTLVYQCQYKLARFFQSTGDKWLADHFFENCLMTTHMVHDDEGRLAAEGHCNVGIALEQNGEYFEAAENFELYHNLSKGKNDWVTEEGEPMHYKAAANLARIYTTIATKHETAGDLAMYLSYLEKANQMAYESGDRKLESDSCYRVGVAYEKNQNSETALKQLNRYLEICSALDDNEGYGKACEAIAKSYESQGKIEESIKYLEMFVEVAEKTNNEKATSRACSHLGAMFNSLGRYDQAVEYFNKSYNISRALNDTETISSSRVLFGVAAAHKMLQNFSIHVELNNRPTMERIIEWKDNRGDEFDKNIPEPAKEGSKPATPVMEKQASNEVKEEPASNQETDS